MKNYFLALIGLCFILACNKDDGKLKEISKKEVVEQKVAEQKIEYVKIPAPSLKDNLIGENSEREVMVFLPPTYAEEKKTYPVVYFLVGYGTTLEEFDNWARIKRIMAITYENKSINEMILVVIDGQTKAGSSFYTNSKVYGNWENYVSKDIVNFLDNNYRTIKDKKSRAITGQSMGGFGAINIGMKYPEVFGHVYSMDPGLFDENGLKDSQFYSDSVIKEQLELWETFNKLSQKSINPDFIKNMSFNISYGLAFSQSENFPFYQIPYKEKNGKLVKDKSTWENLDNGFGNWKEKVSLYKDNLSKLDSLIIDYGISDSYTWIPRGCKYLDTLLKTEQIPHEMRPHGGDHGGAIFERMTKYMFPYFSDNLKFQ